MNEVLLRNSELKANKFYIIKLNNKYFYLGQAIPAKGFDCVTPLTKPHFFNLIQNVDVLEKLQNRKQDIKTKLTENINNENDMLAKRLLETLLKIVENDFKIFKVKELDSNIAKMQCYLYTDPSLVDFLKGNDMTQNNGNASVESIQNSYNKMKSIVDNIKNELASNAPAPNRGGKKSRKQNKKSKSRKLKKSKSRKNRK